jgi:hypothetical protein
MISHPSVSRIAIGQGLQDHHGNFLIVVILTPGHALRALAAPRALDA